nr:MAG TPA: Glycine rich protein family [Caudoviricetes sp.]
MFLTNFRTFFKYYSPSGFIVGNNSRYALSCLIMLYYLTFRMKSKTFLLILLLSCFIL